MILSLEMLKLYDILWQPILNNIRVEIEHTSAKSEENPRASVKGSASAS